jgi:four helix bundle protein
MKITRFEDLECWQESVDLVEKIYNLTKQGQFISIPSNIAEGKERETVNEFIRFLYIAKGSAGELRTQIIIANKIGYIDERTSIELLEKIGKIGGMLGNLIKTLKKGRDR